MTPMTKAAIQELTQGSMIRGVCSLVFRSVGSHPRWTSAERPDKPSTTRTAPAERSNPAQLPVNLDFLCIRGTSGRHRRPSCASRDTKGT